MKKLTGIFMLALLLLSLADSATAQYTFVVDALIGDSTALYPYDAQWSETWVHIGDKVGMLPNGTEVTIAATDTVPKLAYFKSLKKGMFTKDVEFKEQVIAVTYSGSKYLVSSKDLIISPNDTSGIHDFINKGKSQHTQWGHWYYTATPFYAILILLALATLLAALTGGSAGPRLIPTILVPICLLLAIVIEVMGVYTLGKDLLWWIDSDRIAKGTVIFRLVLFGVAVVMQIFSMRLYKNALSESAADELTVKRPIVGALVGAGLLLASFLVAAIWNKSLDAEKTIYVGIGLLLLSTVIGIISAAVRNINAVGFGAGLAFTLFAVIYGVGLVVALVMLIIGFVNVFMEMIVTIGGGALVLYLMSHFVPSRTYTRSDGTVVEVYEV